MTEVLSDMLVRIYHHYNCVDFVHVLFIDNLMWKKSELLNKTSTDQAFQRCNMIRTLSL